ncbi:glycosyltransferase [Seminavis robusta]|uniref:Glycosyltransferase n=1 Tax=Seminavis robusta TaxID=568900 RepID=A0A9N8H808_9STRA|nr:glycosyltransferase [Seminavis robusta]|eukprot:Sro156_g070660.1 glycosyltransferase (123) ;mRNA; f:17444-17812
MAQEDTKQIHAALVTGAHALHYAFQEFCKDAGICIDPQGVGFKPVTVVGRGEFEGEFITREMMSLPMKRKQYAKMGMRSFREDKMQSSLQSCLSALFQYHHQHNHNLLGHTGLNGDTPGMGG